MAQGRLITNKITKDKRVNDLSDDTSRLAFTWLITFADCEGRTYGDPALVRSLLFPRRQDITIEQMGRYIDEWHKSGLIEWYEAEGDLYISFPAFDRNQPGLRKEREAASSIPQPTGITPQVNDDELRTNSGLTPEQIPVKLIKVKLNDSCDGEKSPPSRNAGDKAEKQKREPTPQENQRNDLQKYFLVKSGLPLPRDYKELNKLWRTPLADILGWVEYKQDRAEILVEESITHARKENLTISSPLSIKKIASDLYAKRNGNGH